MASLSRGLMQAVVDAVRQHGSKAAAARALGMHVSTLKTRYDAALNAGLVQEKAKVDILPLGEKQRYEDQISILKRELRDALRDVSSAEDIRSSIFKLTAQPLDPPKWVVKAGGKQMSKNTPILFTSDFQWGEVINLEEMDGVNEYSPAIARERYQRLISKTIDLSFHHMTSPEYEGLFYLRGGDSVSGDIHDELRETNEMSPNPAVKDMARQEIRGIEQLADAFGKVHVISVPGNHGRTTVKSHSKHYADLSWDDILSWMIESYFNARGDKRVTFFTPRSGDAYFDVAANTFFSPTGTG